MSSRREILREVRAGESTHAGLWLDKLLPSQDSDGTKGAHIKQLERVGIPQGYAEAYDRRRRALVDQTSRPSSFACLAMEARSCGRLIVGLGQKSVLEVGITLDHTWGVPYLPGSSLKGIAAWAARESNDPSWHEGGESFLALFGDTDEAGAVHFLDAWWKPDGKQPIHLDTMTVHHPEYYQYQGSGDPPPPSDTDSPTPIAFASASGTFEVILEGPAEWVEAAVQLLKRGLTEHGIGAKTAGGYGRMELIYRSAAERDEARRKEAQARKNEFAEMAQGLNAGNAAHKVPRILEKVPDDLRHEIAQAIRDKLTMRWLKARTDQGWVRDLLAAAGDREA